MCNLQIIPATFQFDDNAGSNTNGPVKLYEFNF